MAEDPFILEANTIQAQLKTAIFDRNTQAIDQLARELRRYWVVALVRGYRDGFQVVNKALLSVASMAHSYADLDEPSDPWLLRYRIWEFLGEAGTMIQRIHTEWIAQERLAEITHQKFQYAEQTLQFFLENEGVVSFSSLLKHMGKTIEKGQNEETSQSTPKERNRHTSAALNNHLRRLTGYGLVDRAGWGVYHLTTLGEQAAKLLKEREPRVEEPVEKLEEIELAQTKKDNNVIFGNFNKNQNRNRHGRTKNYLSPEDPFNRKTGT